MFDSKDRYTDFNLILYIAKFIDINLAYEFCKRISKGVKIEEDQEMILKAIIGID